MLIYYCSQHYTTKQLVKLLKNPVGPPPGGGAEGARGGPWPPWPPLDTGLHCI